MKDLLLDDKNVVDSGCMNISGYDVKIEDGKAKAAKAAKYSTGSDNKATCAVSNAGAITVTVQ